MDSIHHPFLLFIFSTIAPQCTTPFLQFSESSLGRLCLFALTLPVLLQRNTPLFLFTSINSAKFSIPFSQSKLQPQVWWSPEVEDAVSKRRNAFTAAYRSDKNHHFYISASQHSSSVITKIEAWQATRSSLSLSLSPKSVCSLLICVADSSSSPNFSNCPPSKSVWVYLKLRLSTT